MGTEPDDVNAEILDIIELGNDTGQIADPVAV
jgi:hypothetical protein